MTVKSFCKGSRCIVILKSLSALLLQMRHRGIEDGTCCSIAEQWLQDLLDALQELLLEQETLDPRVVSSLMRLGS